MHRPNAPLGATRRRLAAGLAALAPVAALPRPGAAQLRYPARPVRMVVPFPPGGSTDIYARLLAARLSERLGQPVLVDNRPGAGGAIAAGLVVRAEPDGHTVLYTSSALAILPSLRPDLGFDVRRDLVPVALVYEAPLLLVAAPAFAEAATVAGLVAAARAAPGRIDLAHPGDGTTNHLAAALFARAAGAEMVLVPYAGNAGVLNALLRGEVRVAFDTIATSAALVRDGALRAVAVTGARRSPAMPEVPTVAESGLPGYEAVFWNGVFAPAGTPAPVVARLNAEVDAALRLPEVVDRVREIGALPAGGPPEAMARRFRADLETWGRVVREAGLQGE